MEKFLKHKHLFLVSGLLLMLGNGLLLLRADGELVVAIALSVTSVLFLLFSWLCYRFLHEIELKNELIGCPLLHNRK